jgi:hypothetical protein
MSEQGPHRSGLWAASKNMVSKSQVCKNLKGRGMAVSGLRPSLQASQALAVPWVLKRS